MGEVYRMTLAFGSPEDPKWLDDWSAEAAIR
jgi:hypothetical protein